MSGATDYGHRHAEAFMLMLYRADNGEYENIWNSRDGVTPFVVTLRSGAEARHVRWATDIYAPDHVPEEGERVFIDLHPERALEIATRKVDTYWEHPKYPMAAMFRDKRAAIEALWRDYYRPDAPDLVEVTPFLRERFEVERDKRRAALVAEVERLR